MLKEDYKKIVNKYLKKPNKYKNYKYAFITGGLIGLISEILYKLIKNIFNLSKINSASIVTLILIIVSSFLTSIGIMDKMICKCRSGLIIPTTGFAHSITSSAIDYKKEGLITGIGSNFFKLAGSVIICGIISAFIFILIKVIIHV